MQFCCVCVYSVLVYVCVVLWACLLNRVWLFLSSSFCTIFLSFIIWPDALWPFLIFKLREALESVALTLNMAPLKPNQLITTMLLKRITMLLHALAAVSLMSSMFPLNSHAWKLAFICPRFLFLYSFLVFFLLFFPCLFFLLFFLSFSCCLFLFTFYLLFLFVFLLFLSLSLSFSFP